MSMIEVNEKDFASAIRRNGVTMAEFGAVWCPPCKALLPMLDELSVKHAEILTVLKVDCDDSPELASRFGVMSMPTVVVFHNGEPVQKFVGLQPRSVYENALAKYAAVV